MTDNQWYVEIAKVLDPTDPKGTRDAVCAIVDRIRLDETKRCAALVEAAGDTTLAKLILAGCSPERKAER